MQSEIMGRTTRIFAQNDIIDATNQRELKKIGNEGKLIYNPFLPQF